MGERRPGAAEADSIHLHPLGEVAMSFTIQRTLAAAIALAIAAAPGARAADIKVDVTGTNIKRIDGETGQPLQVITREEIASTGATTAMELLDRIAINSPVGNYTLANAFGDSARIGFSGASLRGLGYKYTVVLLNGRRIANYAHDGTAADLNAIPLGAIERVEVLKDGASAIYGTDAIGGVINFITRSDYKGIEASVYYGDTFDGGAREKSVTATLGFGDLSKDRYNAFVSMQWMKQEPLFGRDRPFMSSSYIPSEGLDSTSGRSFPGNVAVPGIGNRNPAYPIARRRWPPIPRSTRASAASTRTRSWARCPRPRSSTWSRAARSSSRPTTRRSSRACTRRTSTGSCCSRCRSGPACCSRRRARARPASCCRRPRRSTRTTSPRCSGSTASRSTSSGARSTRACATRRRPRSRRASSPASRAW
jgi:outer membrane receptor protein involved in Fe transport